MFRPLIIGAPPSPNPNAFEYLHAQHVLYRDLKPENVLICASGHIKLCDFGLAAYGLMSASATHTSASGKPVMVGTTEYMAPEVVRQMACGQAIDGSCEMRGPAAYGNG